MDRRLKDLVADIQRRSERVAIAVQGPPPGRRYLRELQRLKGDADAVFRSLRLPSGQTAHVVYLDGMVNADEVEERLIKPLLLWTPKKKVDLKFLAEKVLTAADLEEVAFPPDLLNGVLEGKTALLIADSPGALLAEHFGPAQRKVEKPAIEFSIRGPRDAFTETLSWNLALIRRRIRDPALRVRPLQVGVRSKSTVCLVYLENVAPPQVVQELEKRIRRIQVDALLDSGYLEQLIEDYWWSPFPTINGSERPDVVAAGILEGRVALVIDNTSYVLLAPATFDGMFHSPEDSYERWLPVSLIRWIRFLAAFLAIATPSLYLALTAYNPGLLPRRLALKAATAREGVVFPVAIEVFLIQIALEIIKEAGFRTPSPIGQIFGVVGGLVLGEIGVRAGIFSELMVIVIAITALASFSLPTFPLSTTVRLLGFVLLLFTTVLGLYGFLLGFFLLGVHLASLSSFGVPYLTPYTLLPFSDWKDSLLKLPLALFRERPTFLKPRDQTMQQPHPPSPLREDRSGRAGPE